MTPECAIRVENRLSEDLSAQREYLYKNADALDHRLSKPKLLRQFLNVADYWLGKNTPQKKFEWSLDTFERRAAYLREQITADYGDEQVPLGFYEAIRDIDLNSL